MACACSTRTCHWLDSVRDAPGLKCQGSARSVPDKPPPPPPLIAQTHENTGDVGRVLAQTFENKALKSGPPVESGTGWGLQETEKEEVAEARNSPGRDEVPNAVDLRD